VTLIIEDGTTPAGANSYVPLVDAREYGAARGVDLSPINAILEAQALQAMDYIESHSSRFVGDQSSRGQSLSWPRDNVVIENWSWMNTEIPRQVLNAQLALIIEIHNGEDPFNPAQAALPVISKKVDGAVEVKYANPVSALKVRKTQKSKTHINLLLKNSGLVAIRS
jgi:hypothetical protein